MQWKQSTSLPEAYGELEVKECKPEFFRECAIVFSGLDSSVAGEIETDFVEANLVVFSNAKNHRQNVRVSSHTNT